MTPEGDEEDYEKIFLQRLFPKQTPKAIEIEFHKARNSEGVSDALIHTGEALICKMPMAEWTNENISRVARLKSRFIKLALMVKGLDVEKALQFLEDIVRKDDHLGKMISKWDCRSEFTRGELINNNVGNGAVEEIVCGGNISCQEEESVCNGNVCKDHDVSSEEQAIASDGELGCRIGAEVKTFAVESESQQENLDPSFCKCIQEFVANMDGGNNSSQSLSPRPLRFDVGAEHEVPRQMVINKRSTYDVTYSVGFEKNRITSEERVRQRGFEMKVEDSRVPSAWSGGHSYKNACTCELKYTGGKPIVSSYRVPARGNFKEDYYHGREIVSNHHIKREDFNWKKQAGQRVEERNSNGRKNSSQHVFKEIRRKQIPEYAAEKKDYRIQQGNVSENPYIKIDLHSSAAVKKPVVVQRVRTPGYGIARFPNPHAKSGVEKRWGVNSGFQPNMNLKPFGISSSRTGSQYGSNKSDCCSVNGQSKVICVDALPYGHPRHPFMRQCSSPAKCVKRFCNHGRVGHF